MLAPLIVVLGVSGVGKSKLTNNIHRLRPDILCISAGELLRKKLRTTSEKLRTAEKSDIKTNQLLLIKALENERRGQENRPVLIEAHSFIDNGRGFVDVPVGIIKKLNADGIILVSTDPKSLSVQRQEDKRERPNRTIEELEEHLKHSENLSYYYSMCLKIPIIKIRSNQYEMAISFIDSHIFGRKN